MAVNIQCKVNIAVHKPRGTRGLLQCCHRNNALLHSPLELQPFCFMKQNFKTSVLKGLATLCMQIFCPRVATDHMQLKDLLGRELNRDGAPETMAVAPNQRDHKSPSPHGVRSAIASSIDNKIL